MCVIVSAIASVRVRAGDRFMFLVFVMGGVRVIVMFIVNVIVMASAIIIVSVVVIVVDIVIAIVIVSVWYH